MKVQGVVPAMDGTDRLIPIELEITDLEMIRKITVGLIKDISLDPQPAKCEVVDCPRLKKEIWWGNAESEKPKNSTDM